MMAAAVLSGGHTPDHGGHQRTFAPCSFKQPSAGCWGPRSDQVPVCAQLSWAPVLPCDLGLLQRRKWEPDSLGGGSSRKRTATWLPSPSTVSLSWPGAQLGGVVHL